MWQAHNCLNRLAPNVIQDRRVSHGAPQQSSIRAQWRGLALLGGWFTVS
jgi:hypothetical protein